MTVPTAPPRATNRNLLLAAILAPCMLLFAAAIGFIGYNVATSPNPANAVDVTNKYLGAIHEEAYQEACRYDFLPDRCSPDGLASFHQRHSAAIDAWVELNRGATPFDPSSVLVLSGGPGKVANIAIIKVPASQFEAADIVPPEREFCLYVVATDDAWIPFKDDWVIPSDLLSVCPR